jgi:hypothetical protein
VKRDVWHPWSPQYFTCLNYYNRPSLSLLDPGTREMSRKLGNVRCDSILLYLSWRKWFADLREILPIKAYTWRTRIRRLQWSMFEPSKYLQPNASTTYYQGHCLPAMPKDPIISTVFLQLIFSVLNSIPLSKTIAPFHHDSRKASLQLPHNCLSRRIQWRYSSPDSLINTIHPYPSLPQADLYDVDLSQPGIMKVDHTWTPWSESRCPLSLCTGGKEDVT